MPIRLSYYVHCKGERVSCECMGDGVDARV